MDDHRTHRQRRCRGRQGGADPDPPCGCGVGPRPIAAKSKARPSWDRLPESEREAISRLEKDLVDVPAAKLPERERSTTVEVASVSPAMVGARPAPSDPAAARREETRRPDAASVETSKIAEETADSRAEAGGGAVPGRAAREINGKPSAEPSRMSRAPAASSVAANERVPLVDIPRREDTPDSARRVGADGGRPSAAIASKPIPVAEGTGAEGAAAPSQGTVGGGMFSRGGPLRDTKPALREWICGRVGKERLVESRHPVWR